MRCSQCSNPVKPIVVFDIDGTLGDYHGHFTDFCIRYFGRHMSVGAGPYDGSVEFEEYLGITKAEYREAKLAYRQGGNKRWMPCYAEAPEIIEDTREIAEVWICTTRPWQRLDNVDPDTREWMRRNHIEVDGLLYGDTKYEQLVTTVERERIAAVVEDLPEQFAIARSLGLPVILRENHHNAGGVSLVPRGNLVTCGAWAVAKAEQWIERHKETHAIH